MSKVDDIAAAKALLALAEAEPDPAAAKDTEGQAAAAATPEATKDVDPQVAAETAAATQDTAWLEEKPAKQLDRRRPFGTAQPPTGTRRYTQDGVWFDYLGREVGDAEA